MLTKNIKANGIKTLYTLKLHECMMVPCTSIRVMRVPGGWLYTTSFDPKHESSEKTRLQTFVPYSEDLSE